VEAGELVHSWHLVIPTPDGGGAYVKSISSGIRAAVILSGVILSVVRRQPNGVEGPR
jgi:hypothetical protein